MKIIKRVLIVVVVILGIFFVIGMFSGGDSDSTDSSADKKTVTEDKEDVDTIGEAEDGGDESGEGTAEKKDVDSDNGDGWSDTYNTGTYEEAQSNDVKATYGTYLTEEDDPPYEMTISDNGNGGVYVKIVADNHEFYCPDAYVVKRESDEWEEDLYNGIRIIATNDDDEDEEEIQIEVGVNDDMWILDVYSEYFGQYMEK